MFSERSIFPLTMKNAVFLCSLHHSHFPSAQVWYRFKAQHSNFVNIHSEFSMAWVWTNEMWFSNSCWCKQINLTHADWQIRRSRYTHVNRITVITELQSFVLWFQQIVHHFEGFLIEIVKITITQATQVKIMYSRIVEFWNTQKYWSSCGVQLK